MNIKNIILSLLLPLIVFTSCNNKEQPSKTAKKKKLPLVSVQIVKVQNMVSSITITGTIEPNVYSDIVSTVDGVLDELRARENQWVKKGEIIAIINPNERVNLIAKNQLIVEQLQNSLNSLSKDSKDYVEVNANLEKAISNLEYAKNMYQTIPIICPVDGMITKRYLDVGAQLKAKDKILTITDMSSLVIKAQVNEKYISAIKKGRKLELQLNAYPNEPLAGVINLVYPEINAETRSVSFDIKILNFCKTILSGMMATVKIPVNTIEQAVVIPANAVLTSPDNKSFLFVIDKNSKAHKQLVETGISVNGMLQITKGLKEGNKVAVKGQEMLKDGIEVKIIK